MARLPASTDLRQLRNMTEPYCLTIYAPPVETNPSGATNPNKIELKNLLVQAETALLADGVDERTVKATLRPARGLLDSAELWWPHSESLALFMHPKLFKYFYIPADMPHLLTISRGFNLEPLQAVLDDNRPYLLLALSHKNVQLFEGDRFRLHQLQLRHFPSNLEEALNIDEYPRAAEPHAVGVTGGGKGSDSFYGRYNVRQTKKETIFIFFRMIDRRLRQLLRQKGMPLILAGVEYLQPIYRQANTSPHLMAGGIRGNVEHADHDELRKQAWALLKQEGAP